jgi:hypothetical protein
MRRGCQSQESNAPSIYLFPHKPLSTEIGFNRTEKIISDLTDYCPTFGPLSPNNENKFDLEAVLDNLQDQMTDSCVVPNQLVLDNANVSINNIYDKTNIKLINAIAFLATPSSSPFIGTPDLPSPIRQIILNDIESEPTESSFVAMERCVVTVVSIGLKFIIESWRNR